MTPNYRKGKKYKTEISAIGFLDLLGYGSMLEKVKFNPTHPDSISAVARMEVFQRKAANFTMRYLRALILNDGIIYSRQLSRRSNSVTYDFLTRVYLAFNEINQIDINKGNPGVRGIITVGPRMRINGVFKHQKLLLQNIIKRHKENLITTEEAISEAFSALPLTSSSTDLQANFAFTKAYFADNAGSRKGLKGPNLFVDRNIFSDEIPDWVTIVDRLKWSEKGMDFDFLQIGTLDVDEANKQQQQGVKNAVEIGKVIGIQY